MVKIINSAEKLQEILNSNVQRSDGELVVLGLNMNNYNESVMRTLICCVQKYIDLGYIPQVKFSVNDLNYTIKDFELIYELEDEFRDVGVDVCFSEYTHEFSVDETFDAFTKCKDYADYVSKIDASPFEKYLMIYRYLTTFVYKENKNDPMKARRLISVMNGDDIVCVGYSKLLKYLCDAAGIKCETQQLSVYKEKEKKTGKHQNNIVYIKDEKYGLDGYYYVDCCWDSVKKGKEPFMLYNYALLPLSDVEHFKDKRMDFELKTSALYNDGVFEQVFLSQRDGTKIAGWFGIERERIGLPMHAREDYDENSKIAQAAKKVKELFLKAGVPKDYLSKEKGSCFPTCFYPEMFIALMLVEPPEVEMINYYVNILKNALENESVESVGFPRNLYFYNYGYEDIYEEFDKFIGGEINFNLWDISDYYENLEFTKIFENKIKKIRQSSAPISSELMEQAIRESLIKEGCDERYAMKEASRAMTHSQRRAERIFDREATNCFMRVAVEKRMIENGII